MTFSVKYIYLVYSIDSILVRYLTQLNCRNFLSVTGIHFCTYFELKLTFKK